MAKKSALKVVIAYENLDAGVRAKKMSERVAAEFNTHFHLQSDLYKFAFLDHPQLREEAIIQATMADLIIISTNDEGELPGHVKNWLEEWLPCRKKGQSALVALLGSEVEDSWMAASTRDYLEEAARRGNMDFFCRNERRPSSPAPTRHSIGVEIDSPHFTEAHGDSRWRDWGIND